MSNTNFLNDIFTFVNSWQKKQQQKIWHFNFITLQLVLEKHTR
jgi:hypothetical protein